jgi:hypothetical protein
MLSGLSPIFTWAGKEIAISRSKQAPQIDFKVDDFMVSDFEYLVIMKVSSLNGIHGSDPFSKGFNVRSS